MKAIIETKWEIQIVVDRPVERNKSETRENNEGANFSIIVEIQRSCIKAVPVL